MTFSFRLFGFTYATMKLVGLGVWAARKQVRCQFLQNEYFKNGVFDGRF